MLPLFMFTEVLWTLREVEHANAEVIGAGSAQQRQPRPLPGEQLECACHFQTMNEPIDSQSPADATQAVNGSCVCMERQSRRIRERFQADIATCRFVGTEYVPRAVRAGDPGDTRALGSWVPLCKPGAVLGEEVV